MPLTKCVCFAVADSGGLNSEKAKLLENMKRELKAKDRQIESLEEQLQSATRVEIKKLRRGPSGSRHVIYLFYLLTTTFRPNLFLIYGLLIR